MTLEALAVCMEELSTREKLEQSQAGKTYFRLWGREKGRAYLQPTEVGWVGHVRARAGRSCELSARDSKPYLKVPKSQGDRYSSISGPS